MYFSPNALLSRSKIITVLVQICSRESTIGSVFFFKPYLVNLLSLELKIHFLGRTSEGTRANRMEFRLYFVSYYYWYTTTLVWSELLCDSKQLYWHVEFRLFHASRALAWTRVDRRPVAVRLGTRRYAGVGTRDGRRPYAFTSNGLHAEALWTSGEYTFRRMTGTTIEFLADYIPHFSIKFRSIFNQTVEFSVTLASRTGCGSKSVPNGVAGSPRGFR